MDLPAAPSALMLDGAEAYSSLEAVMMVLSPVQLGAQFLNHVHSTSGLPWWASIPLAAVAARAVLLPLSLRAKASSANLVLINSALAKAKLIRGSIAAAKVPAAAAAAVVGSLAGHLPRGVGMWSLSRGVYQHMRAQQRVPALRWYVLNGLVQASVFGSLSLALGRMSSSLWPGLSSEGALYFTDLTSPAVYLETLSTPFGTLGVMLPLSLVLLYTSSVDLTAAARVPGVLTALRLITLPYYCIALLQPHATLLLWGSLSASHHALQLLLSSPVWAARAGMPAVLLLPPRPAPKPATDQKPAQADPSGSVEADEGMPGARPRMHSAPEGSGQLVASVDAQDAALLLFLGRRYKRRRRTEAAAACFRMALKLSPDCEDARREINALGAN